MFVLKLWRMRNKYAAKEGSPKAYVPLGHPDLLVFPTKEAAKKEQCAGCETVVPMPLSKGGDK